MADKERRKIMLGLKRSLACCVSLLLLSGASAVAADTNEFLARIYTNAANKTLRYCLLLPKGYDAKQTYPAILYLHGAAARGNDNAEPLNWGPRLFLEPALRERHGFFLIVPQCPRGSGWIESAWNDPFLAPGKVEGVAPGAQIGQRRLAQECQHRSEGTTI